MGPSAEFSALIQIAEIRVGSTVLRAVYEPQNVFELEHAVLHLIEFVQLNYTKTWRKLLRAHITVNEEPPQWVRELVKVGAKRLKIDSTLTNAEIPENVTFIERSSVEPALSSAFGNFLQNVTQGPLHSRARDVSVEICDANGNILTRAVNQGSIVRIWHAELLAVREWMQRTGTRLPKDSRVHTTLMPCRMCAEVIAAFSEDGADTRVHVYRSDPTQEFFARRALRNIYMGDEIAR